MKILTGIILAAVCFVLLSATTASALDRKEHRLIADSALHVVLRECPQSLRDAIFAGRGFTVQFNGSILENQSFGDITAADFKNDMCPSRFHIRGKTILQQLGMLDSLRINATMQEYAGTGIGNPGENSASLVKLYSLHLPKATVAENYLMYHLIALRWARLAAERNNNDLLRSALIYEAMAQSYLGDAFSSGHMMLSLSDYFSWVHPVNNQEAHDYYGNNGVYVMNSKGEVWRTFGDGLLQWYDASFEYLLGASCNSLCELFLVYYASSGADVPVHLKEWAQATLGSASIPETVRKWMDVHSGDFYYSVLKMPTLLLLPMPVSATWSIRTDKIDTHEISARKHYPQLSEPDCHDPDLEGLDQEFLYSAEALPVWLRPPFIGASKDSIKRIIRHDRNVASVRYIDEGYFPPTYFGFLVSTGMFQSVTCDGAAYSFGLGYAPKLALLPDVSLIDRFSADVSFSSFGADNRRQLLSLAVGTSLFNFYGSRISSTGSFHPVESLGFKMGYGWGLREPYREKGLQFSIRCESGVIPFGFTYAGVTVQVVYQWMFLEKTIHGLGMTLTLQ